MLIPNSSYFLMPGFCFVFLAELKQQHQQQKKNQTRNHISQTLLQLVFRCGLLPAKQLQPYKIWRQGACHPRQRPHTGKGVLASSDEGIRLTGTDSTEVLETCPQHHRYQTYKVICGRSSINPRCFSRLLF